MPSTTRTVNVGLIGLGTVGGGVARVIARHHDEYLSAYGIDFASRWPAPWNLSARKSWASRPKPSPPTGTTS